MSMQRLLHLRSGHRHSLIDWKLAVLGPPESHADPQERRHQLSGRLKGDTQ